MNAVRLDHLLANNKAWAARIEREHPGFFAGLVAQQSPQYLWIGCSDSRVPANQIVGLPPGELFVHRNVANVVSNTDFNVLSVLQYAIEVLKVQHVIVCGHYGCGGIRAALSKQTFGLIDNWLSGIKDIYAAHRGRFAQIAQEAARADLLCELNVKSQVRHVCHTTIVQSAWQRGQPLRVHGWVYDLEDGLLRDLGVTTEGPEQLAEIYRYEQ